MIKTNIKMRVTPEQSKKVQEICFANGVEWPGGKILKHLDEPFLFIDYYVTYTIKDQEEFFVKEKNEEVSAELFIRTNGTCIEEKNYNIGEKMKMPNEFKVRVNSEESEKLQELLFENGFSWNGNKEVRYLDCNYTYSSNKRLFLLDDEYYFNKCTYRELTVEQILSYYANKEDSHNAHYKAQKIDTIARCKANMTLEQQKAICIFNIDRYLHREKGQNLSDIKKIKDYTNWLEEIEIELENER